MKRDIIFHGFFMALLILTLYQFFVIIEPFLTPLLGAMVLAIISFPVHRAIQKLLPRWNDSAQAALSTLAIIMLVIGPFAIALGLVIQESSILLPLAQETITQVVSWGHGRTQFLSERLLPLAQRIPFISDLSSDQIQKSVSLLAGALFSRISTLGKGLVSNAFLTTLNLLILLFAEFFLLRDGERILKSLKKGVPLQHQDKERILRRIETTVLGLVRGSVLTIMFQTICATVGYLIVGVPAAVTLGLLTGMAAVIPFLGTALVWAPTGIYLLLFTSVWKGVFLLIWGVIVISLTDNIVRTYFIGREAKLPIFLLFIGLLGGISVYGLRGLLIGPLLVAILPILLDIFETHYLARDNENKN